MTRPVYANAMHQAIRETEEAAKAGLISQTRGTEILVACRLLKLLVEDALLEADRVGQPEALDRDVGANRDGEALPGSVDLQQTRVLR